MPAFSAKSQRILETCDTALQIVFREVIQHFDCSIISGHRGAEEQSKLFMEGSSRLEFPNSKHNSNPSKAVDVAPYPVDWGDDKRFTLFAGYVLGIARSRGIRLRWGGDWAMRFDPKNNDFQDLAHFELID